MVVHTNFLIYTMLNYACTTALIKRTLYFSSHQVRPNWSDIFLYRKHLGSSMLFWGQSPTLTSVPTVQYSTVRRREFHDIQIRLTCRPLINHVKRGHTLPCELPDKALGKETPNGITTLLGNYTTLSNSSSCKYKPKLNIPLWMPTLRSLAPSAHPITVCCV